MEKSAGLLIIKDNKILLCHPTNSSWFNTYSIPKGKIEEGEDEADAAIRETKEEIGLDIDKNLINNKEKKEIEYKNKKGEVYKKVYYYVIYINYDYDVINKKNLQLEEVDWAGFLSKEKAKNKIFWRFKEMLDYLI